MSVLTKAVAAVGGWYAADLGYAAVVGPLADSATPEARSQYETRRSVTRIAGALAGVAVAWKFA